MDVYLEVGDKKVFASAADWPGWSRSGRDEESALKALLDSAPRYAQLLEGSGLNFPLPEGINEFEVVERVPGDATTDFGAPGTVPNVDKLSLHSREVERFEVLLREYWAAFDGAYLAAEGIELRKGPRGGGRDQDKIVEHVLEADIGYLGKIGWKVKRKALPDDLYAKLQAVREEILAGLEAKVRGELPEEGPRGGARWPARYYVRRSGWHTLDHTWEIEDRAG